MDAFLTASPWREFAEVFYCGEPTKLRSRPVHESSGFAFNISNPDEDQLEVQLRESSEFLHEERAEIERLVSFSGVACLEFRIGLFWWRDTLCQFHSLPPDFMRLAGELGVTVTLCVYGADCNEQPAKQKADA